MSVCLYCFRRPLFFIYFWNYLQNSKATLQKLCRFECNVSITQCIQNLRSAAGRFIDLTLTLNPNTTPWFLTKCLHIQKCQHVCSQHTTVFTPKPSQDMLAHVFWKTKLLSCLSVFFASVDPCFSFIFEIISKTQKPLYKNFADLSVMYKSLSVYKI